MNAITETARIDVSALSWCLAEIQATLEQSEASLRKSLAENNDQGQLRAAQNFLHQAHGALAVVDVSGLSKITEESERLLDLVSQGQVELSGALVQAVSDGYHALIEYSENLVDGSAHQPVLLFAYLRDLQQLRSAERIHPADLFFPNLSVKPPRMPDDGTAWQEGEIKLTRGQFEQGLLKYLRDSNDVVGRKEMLAAVARIENAERKSAGHTFWWVALAFFDAMQDAVIANDVYSKRLVAKLNLQVRKSLEQSGQVPEQLLIDTLFQIARVKVASPFVAQVQQMYGIQNVVPKDYDSARYRRQDSASLAQFKQSLAECKLVWDRVSRGQNEAQSEFEAHVRAMQSQATALGANGMAKLCDAMIRVVGISRNGSASEAVCLEVATALLFVEEAQAKRARIDSEYESRALDMAARLARVAAGSAPAEMPQWLADLSRTAQERQTSAVFVGEMLTNLRSAEKTLDAYFRDPNDATELGNVSAKLRQTAGALLVLGHDHAAAGTNSVADASKHFVAGTSVDEGVANRLASSVSALGFFVESLAKPDSISTAYEFDESDGVFRAKAKQDGSTEATQAFVPEVAALPVDVKVNLTSESSVDVPNLLEKPLLEDATAFQEIDVFAAEESPAQALQPEAALFEDVALFADEGTVAEQAAFAEELTFAEEAIFSEEALLEGVAIDDAVVDLEADLASFNNIVPALAASEALSPEMPSTTQVSGGEQLTDVEIDAELMEIFLGEAEEVLQTIGETQVELAAAPTNVTHLTTIRRAFHTLKGSGRMVGLMQFGEAAWGMEQTMNLWLSEERSANDSLLKTIGVCCEQFAVWVEMLRLEPRSWLDPEPMVENARRLREDEQLLPFQVSGALVAEAPVIESTQIQVVEKVGDTGAVLEVEPVTESEALTEPKALVEPVSVAELGPVLDAAAKPESSVAPDLALGFVVGGMGLAGAVSKLTASDVSAPTQEEQASLVEKAEFNPLHQIFIAESDGLAKVLRDEAVSLVGETLHISSDKAVRAAHSLGGSSLVVGLSQASTIAYSLEKWMLAQQKRRFSPSHGDKKIIELLVARLTAILGAFANGKEQGDESIAVNAALEIAAQHEMDHPGQDLLPGGELATFELESVELDNQREKFGDTNSVIDSVVASRSDEPSKIGRSLVETADQADLLSHGFNDDLDPELLQVFLLEAEEYFPAIGTDLRSWEQTPSDTSLAQSLMRAFHTVKGSARMAGAMTLGQLVHEMETKVESVAHLPRVGPELVSGLIADYDQAVSLFEVLKDPSKAAALMSSKSGVDASAHEPLMSQSSVLAATSMTALAAVPVVNGAAQSASALLASTASLTQIRPRADLNAAQSASASAAQQMVRVRSDLLERMVNEAGEVSITRSRMENEVGSIKTSINDLTENVHRLRAQLREIEIQAESQIQARHQSQQQSANFDPLEFDRFTRFQELTRMMAESVNDVATVQSNLMKSLNEASADLTCQAQVTRDLQQNLMRVRMVQFGTISDRLYRVIRQAAKDSGKRVNLDIRGTAAEIDRSVLERMAGPLEHLLRNSVAHGIESPDNRVIAGKSETGEISVEVRQEGNEVVLSLVDDGAGLNFAKIQERAVANGLLAKDAQVSEQELAELIFMPGFSTATEVTALAGRGVGMDVVRSEVAALGGRIETWSKASKGTRFVVHLPLTLAVTQVVLVSVGDTKFALPSVLVEKVVQLKPEQLKSVYQSSAYEWQDQRIPSDYLGSLLQLPGVTPVAQRYSPLIILRSGSQHAAIHVDSIMGNQEVVVKNVGPQLSRLQGVSGATVLGNGEIVLILNPVQVFASAGYQGRRHAAAQVATKVATTQESGAVNAEATGEVINTVKVIDPKTPDVVGLSSYIKEMPPTVMVVDDSLTVRKVTQRMLGRERYQVVLAKDGVDALRQLQDFVPDVMLVDIEMPRMNGFDLTRNVRNDPRCKHVPIIMITSRTADKHRNHALSLGVNVYLGKPYSEEDLLGHIKVLLGKTVAA